MLRLNNDFDLYNRMWMIAGMEYHDAILGPKEQELVPLELKT